MYLDAFSNIETFHINPLIIPAAELWVWNRTVKVNIFALLSVEFNIEQKYF